jgi:DNA replication licensing factor MCM5
MSWLQDFDSERIYYSNQQLKSVATSYTDPFSDDENDNDANLGEMTEEERQRYVAEKEKRKNERMKSAIEDKLGSAGTTYSLSSTSRHFTEFLRNYKLADCFVYRDALLACARKGTNTLEFSLSHLNEYDPTMLNLLQNSPAVIMPVFEAAALTAYNTLVVQGDADDGEGEEGASIHKRVPAIHLTITAPHLHPVDLRKITSSHVNKLIKAPGIIISATRIRSKAMKLRMTCKDCFHIHEQKITSPYGNATLPFRCQQMNPPTCSTAPYQILPDECVYNDIQSLKLQESPEAVPTGEMPRNLLLCADRSLIDKAKPGMRVSVIGVASLYAPEGGKKDKTPAKQLYIHVLGLQYESAGMGGLSQVFSPAEEEAFIALSRRRDIYQILTNSVAPSIQGDYTVNIKKAIVCQLMGGSAKKLPDGMRLRGDINVLLMGDPSTAKSQFLKFVEKVAPVGVYTSGKGSSAAGLTASVIKDAKGEFYLEGGAMVLADGGIVMIDEFDKMKPADRVAIHEAMEQQTISIAKAGITTVLNSRTAVLAAANPIYGRYDDMKSASENIDLMTTILSRFDLIFIVRDIRDEERDKAIARHVMGVHIDAGSNNEVNTHSALGGGDDDENEDDESVAEKAAKVAADGGTLDIQVFKKFVQYCRARCSPRLSEESSEVLASEYVKIRDGVRRRQAENGGDTAAVVPITVRQLEALVRLSESCAKMRLSSEVAAEDIAEALRLFKVATMAASETDSNNGQDLLRAAGEGADKDAYIKAEAFVRSRVGIGSTVNRSRLIEEAVHVGQNATIVARVLGICVKKGEFQEKGAGGKLVKRLK